MKNRWPVLILLAVLIAALFLPAAGIYIHSQLGEEIAAQFPGHITLWDIAARGNGCLPVSLFPSLSVIDFCRGCLISGLLLTAAAILCTTLMRKGSPVPLLLTGLAAVLYGTFIFQWGNLSGSLLFTIFLKLLAWIYVPLIVLAVLAVINIVSFIRHTDGPTGDVRLRRISGALAAAVLLLMLLPAYVIQVPDSLTGDAADAETIRRNTNMYRITLGAEDNLYTTGQEEGVFTDILGGDLEKLEPFSADAYNIKGIFLIRGNKDTVNVPILAAAVLFLLAAVLSVPKKVDRWFPLSASALGAALLTVNSFSLLSVSEADMYSSASRQLLYLGLGHVTPVPLLAMLTGLASAGAAALGVRRANEPYFVNPLPQRIRLRVVAAVLTAVALVCLLLPAVTVSFTQPGKNKVQATATIRGLDAVTFSAAERLADPVTSKGKEIYKEDDEEYSRKAVNAATARVAQTYTWLTWAALALIAAALVLLILRRSKRTVILLLLVSAVLRIVTWLCSAWMLPRAVTTGSGELWLYASIPLLVFAAFFTNFADQEELPKKYRLFLMMLPFLLAVFLFAYLPLYGWSYAFYNYKFGVPMDQQEFVGLKWFAEMFSNDANRVNVVRVLKNTLGMSGLNLATSWLPMAFAIFLNEITRTRFKKFVQIFTTLPNFISWALVFSFALCLFAADTGIFSKLMMSLGLNDPANPTVWLNSSDHIWLKMWAWSTWKGLGWGAIMYLAAISGIDQELYEAAKVDGAGRWRLMRHITLPGLLPTFFVLLMLSISNILNNGMDQYLVFQNPMNRNTIEVLDLYVYNITIASGSGGTALYSYATAIGILKTLVSVTLLFSANFLSKKLRGESIM